MKRIIFDDEITIWWDLDKFPKADHYTLYLDGSKRGETQKTHYTFKDLQENTTYQIRVEAYSSNGSIEEEILEIQTKCKKKDIDVTKAPYCAVGDGKTINTQALQKALDACKADERVYFPAGVYLTGALNIHSDTEIYVAKNALLQGVKDAKAYLPKINSRFEGVERMCYRSLLNMGELDHTAGYNCQNVVIRGEGAIYGGGVELARDILETERAELKEFLEKNADYVKECEDENTIPGRVRGRLINISNTQNVILSGLSVGFGAAWNIHFIYSKDILTYGCTIRSNVMYDENGQVERGAVWNGDGWDPDSSENCVIFDCLFETFDDGIAIKSGKNPEGNVVNRPTKNVYIFDCRGKNGVAVGTELSGGVEGVYVWDCEYLRSERAINLKTTVKRGGYIKNVSVRKCSLTSIGLRTAVCYNNDGEGAGVLTEISDLYFEDIRLKGNKEFLKESEPIFFEGFSEEKKIQGLTLKNVRIENNNGETQRITIKNVENVVEDIRFE